MRYDAWMRTGIAIVLGLGLAAGCANELRKTKKGEAEIMLDVIAKRMKTYYVQHGQFPTLSIPVPTTSCCEPGTGGKCTPVPGEFEAWSEIDFHVDEPRFYQYGIESSPTKFRAIAAGDLDCDTQTSEFWLKGEAIEGVPKTELLRPKKVD